MNPWKKVPALLALAVLMAAAFGPAALAAPAEGYPVQPGEQFSLTGSGRGLALTGSPNLAANGTYEVSPLAGAPAVEGYAITVESDLNDAERQRLTFTGTLPADTASGSYDYQIGFRLTGASFVIPVTTVTLAVQGEAEPDPSASASPTAPASPEPSAEPSTSASSGPTETPGDSSVIPEPVPDGPLTVSFAPNAAAGITILTGIPISSGADVHTEAALRASLHVPDGVTLSVLQADGASLPEDAPLATGCVLRSQNTAGDVFEATIVVSGDVIGSGRMSIAQVVRIAQSLNGSRPLTGVYAIAGDFNGSGEIDITDVVREARLLYGG